MSPAASTGPDWAGWVRRWEAQQRRHVPLREERFAVLLDALGELVTTPAPVVVDLGCGPGSLAVRLLDRLPGARVVGVDRDPLLLALARGAYGDRPGLRVVDADLRAPGWAEALDLDGRVDAAVSTTALHWLDEPQLRGLAVDLGGLVRPGGCVLDGDHLHDDDEPRLAAARRAVAEGAARRSRQGSAQEVGEDWDAWWAAVRRDPALAELVTARDARRWDHSDAAAASERACEAAFRDAGFAEVGRVWQLGDDRVLVAVR